MLIRIEGVDLPGRDCPAAEGFPGYTGVHVGVQRRNRPGEIDGLQPGDAPSASWTLECTALAGPDGVDIRGPHVQGGPGGRFVYLSWGTADPAGGLTVFRRAKLMFDAVAPDVARAAVESGTLIGRLGLTDAKGHPLCAAVRPPAITWTAAG
ncbi:hypothetical protein GCM10009530_74050 [Microbispora corallina]|uniref:Monooxygenase n=1 Tax=Microbispora corallina TaxID=83302 RepID=A0ABQ4FV35_9ACTN|nr:DUF5990 family protein [Microbispora corallina]GIH38568.1 hypothetical protein Mco01_15680 [Microbispora corallina]